MYERFYGFSEKPFTLLPDPHFLYFGKQHSMAYCLLEYGVLSQAGFTVITGEVGSGKTTLIRHLLNKLPADVKVGLISNTTYITTDLLRLALRAFDQDFKTEDALSAFERFEDFLIRQYAAGYRSALIIDEAQNLNVATLEELRMLSNINADHHTVLQIILVGQPEFRHTLQIPALKNLAQRILVDFSLGPLEEGEVRDYIRFRLTHAGGHPELFTEEAITLIFCHTGGIPRLINALCDMALVYGFAEEVERIDEILIQAVIEERAGTVDFSPV